MAQLTFTPLASGSLLASPNGASRSGGVVTITASAAHGFPASYIGYVVTLQNVTPTSFNGSHVITEIPSATTFKFAQSGATETGGGGTYEISPAQFVDLPDSALAGGQELTEDALRKISHNAYFGVVRSELFFMGYFTHGNTVPTPQSPVDDYLYKYSECLIVPVLASSRQPDGTFVPGQKTFPTLASSDLGTGNLVVVPYQLYVNDVTGALTCTIYFSTSGATGQGTVAVWILAQRQSEN